MCLSVGECVPFAEEKAAAAAALAMDWQLGFGNMSQ